MRRIILFLEDEQHRIDRFRAVLGDAYDFHIWANAFEMADEVADHLSGAAMISLDHDLYPPDDSEDWGDGTTVTSRLAELTPTCPVIVHSSNVDGARRMIGDLQLSGWTARRVAPIGEDWIEADWLQVMREMIE